MRPVFSIDGTFLTGKYQGTLLIAIGIDAEKSLVLLAFALVEKENKGSWAWFLRLVRIHVVGPGRSVCVLSYRHTSILSAVTESIPGHAPVVHHWCTRHLAENLLKKDHVKDNFKLFEDVAKQLEVKLLEELKTKTNAKGRDWLRGLMRDVHKWSRAHDGGWRYVFQTSNMAECFNGLLKGSRALSVTAIVAFTFYKCVEWFASREKYARSMLEKGERLGPNQL
jgi:transposase-like protein